MKKYIKAIVIPLVLGSIIGVIISGYMNYDSLIKPSISPSGWVFPVVWSIIYILMGISYGILDNDNLIDRKVNVIYYSQLVVNLLWSIIFFVFKWRLFAFIWILILIILVVDMIIIFYKKRRVSGLLQLLYLIWIVFASYLNLSIYLLNR